MKWVYIILILKYLTVILQVINNLSNEFTIEIKELDLGSFHHIKYYICNYYGDLQYIGQYCKSVVDESTN